MSSGSEGNPVIGQRSEFYPEAGGMEGVKAPMLRSSDAVCQKRGPFSHFCGLSVCVLSCFRPGPWQPCRIGVLTFCVCYLSSGGNRPVLVELPSSGLVSREADG